VFGAVVFAACVPIGPTAAEHAADYSEAHGSHVLLVRQFDSTVLERAAPDWGLDTPHRLASGTKSFAGVLAIAAAEDGLLSLDELAADTLVEWRNDPRKSQITIRHLLRTRVFDRIGLTVGRWRRDSVGHPLLAAGAYLSANGWVKFGALIAKRGAWNGEQVLDAALVDEMLSPSPANPDYGLSWWLDPDPDDEVNPDPDDIPDDLVSAAGAGGQRLYVVPSRQVVVVRFSEDQTFVDATFLSLLFDAS